LEGIVGASQVLTSARKTEPFRTGFRFGRGQALAVVLPRTLIEQWRVLQACAAFNKIVIMQAANTGLTGGSSPFGNDYDRDVVIINSMAIAAIHVINDGQEVICLPGATLYKLEAVLRPYGREPHSVIGSSCIGASVIGGVCNNSGGALIRRGPAYTEMALYARLDENRCLHLVNHLGVEIEGTPEQILAHVERGDFETGAVETGSRQLRSDRDYPSRIRDIDAETPARFNADARCLFEASGSAGKLAIFAVRLDSFPKDERTKVFYIGTNSPAELTDIRRHILGQFKSLPVSGEYLHRDAFNIAERYGKDVFVAIRALGAEHLPILYRFKSFIDAAALRLGIKAGIADKLLQHLSHLYPSHLPKAMTSYRDRFEHHLMIRMADDGIEEAESFLSSIFPSTDGDFFECSNEVAEKAFLHRFVTAGAAIRYKTMHEKDVEGIVALDIALRRNERDWLEVLPHEISDLFIQRLYYGHFFCQVFHHDYLVKAGNDTAAIEHALCEILDNRGAEYPAEHNVGHMYSAKRTLRDFYRMLDPCNAYNPGIGQTSKRSYWD